MLRKYADVLGLLAATIFVLGPAGARAEEAPAPKADEAPAPKAEVAPASEAEAAPKKLGFYFSMSLQKLSQFGQAHGIGLKVVPPALLGGTF